MKSQRVTQRDVAEKAGVHRATVSLAFRHHPSIPIETRERLLRIADELGYAPDPMLSALAAYRTQQRPASFHGTLSWLVNHELGPCNWRISPHYRDYFEGAKARARHHGYNLELFDFNTPEMSAARMAGILRARGVQGALLCPQPRDHFKLSFPWDSFSFVTFGYTLREPRLHAVSAYHYNAVGRTMRELRSRGYERIGLAINPEHDSRVNNTYTAAYLSDVYLADGELRIPPFLRILDGNETAVGEWIRRHRIDAVLTNNYRVLNILRAAGLAVPEEVGVACASLPKPDPVLSGVLEDSFHIGEVAVDFLVSNVNHGERGVPRQSRRVQVEGLWQEGASLRPAPAAV